MASLVEPSTPLASSRTRRSIRCRPATTRSRSVQSECGSPRPAPGQMLWLDMEVLEGPFQGRHVYDQLNLINPNPTAEEIAQRTLSAICHAVGKLQVADSEELHFLPLLVRVAVKPNGYNEVKGYKPAGQQQPAADRRARPGRCSGSAAGAGANTDRALEAERLIGGRQRRRRSSLATRRRRRFPHSHSENVHGGQDASPGPADGQDRPAGDPPRLSRRDRPAAWRHRRHQGRRSPLPTWSGRPATARWTRAGITGRAPRCHKRQQIAALTAHMQTLPPRAAGAGSRTA